MAHANWAFRQVFGDRDSTEEPADGAQPPPEPQHPPGPLAKPKLPLCDQHPLTCCARVAEDLISAVQFDQTGDYLATGDRGGRVVIFESSEVAHRAAAVSRSVRWARTARALARAAQARASRTCLSLC